MWKLILSPESGEALDLVDHTRRLMSAMERDLGTRLEWVAIDHHNTDNPHVHVALPGRPASSRSRIPSLDQNGRPRSACS